MWIFQSSTKVDRILQNLWKWGAQPLFLKRWHLAYDARIERVDHYPVWVRLTGLPLVLWSDEVFVENGNALGIFYEVDKS